MVGGVSDTQSAVSHFLPLPHCERAHSPDPSERPSLPMSGTVMAAVATPSVGMVVYTTGSDCTTTGMVWSWPTLLGMLTEGIVWMTCRICWPPAP